MSLLHEEWAYDWLVLLTKSYSLQLARTGPILNWHDFDFGDGVLHLLQIKISEPVAVA